MHRGGLSECGILKCRDSGKRKLRGRTVALRDLMLFLTSAW